MHKIRSFLYLTEVSVCSLVYFSFNDHEVSKPSSIRNEKGESFNLDILVCHELKSSGDLSS